MKKTYMVRLGFKHGPPGWKVQINYLCYCVLSLLQSIAEHLRDTVKILSQPPSPAQTLGKVFCSKNCTFVWRGQKETKRRSGIAHQRILAYFLSIIVQLTSCFDCFDSTAVTILSSCILRFTDKNFHNFQSGI